VCNWNSALSYKDNANCDTCTVEIVACTNINTSADCTGAWKFANYLTVGGVFNCFSFNDDPNNVTYSQTVAYSGSFATVFKVKIPDTVDVIGPSSPRAGLQTTFAVPGTVTGDDIYKEVRFAGVGSDTFYAITVVNFIMSYLDPSDPNYNTTQYETSASSVSLLDAIRFNSSTNFTEGYIGVSFSFETLNIQQVNYGFTYKLQNLFGDFAGMLGTLMGLDTVKVMAAIPLTWAAIKMRSCVPLEDLFNG